ncbi:ABC transporter permease [Clostridium sp. C8-1-8]|uniref:FtsX-like permease family protein n=1 Tax=Clostridium sp. C8-1-8 TaxID=2698831 RepID=UPI0013687436|nr:ABC transporter permease [Clostridium sp. C8-1-8]
MTNLKYFLYSLSRKKTFFIMSVFQITFCLTLVFSLYLGYRYSYDRISNIISLYHGKNIYELNKVTFPSNNITMSQAKELAATMEAMQNVEYIDFKQESTAAKYSDKLKKFIIKGQENAPYYNSERIAVLKSVQVNNTLIKLMNFPLKQGSWDQVLKYNNKNIEITPVVLGSDYLDSFKLGDTIEYINPRTRAFSKLLVTGIMDKGATYVVSYNGVGVSLDDAIIYPRIDVEDKSAPNSDIYINKYLGSQVLVKSDLEGFKTKVKESAKKLGYRVAVLDPDKEAEKDINYMKSTVSEAQVIALIITVFSIVSLTVALYSNILKNYREFGIHILLGCKKSDIYKRILYEILFITAISIVLTIIIIKRIFYNSLNYNYINGSIGLLIIFAILLSLIISIVPILQIRKLRLNNMIRGDE